MEPEGYVSFLAPNKGSLEGQGSFECDAQAERSPKSHLLQQRSGLLRNKLGDVESGVTADSGWMAPQQRLRKDGGGGKNR